MKRFILSILLIITFSPLFAQGKMDSWKRLDPLRAQSINFVLDFSSADILGLDAKDFMESCENWDKEYKEIWRRIVSGFNSHAFRARIGNYPGSEYTLFIRPTRVYGNGSDVAGWTQVLNSRGEMIFSRSFYTSEGRVGSVTNLMGDALEKYAQTLGRKF